MRGGISARFRLLFVSMIRLTSIAMLLLLVAAILAPVCVAYSLCAMPCCQHAAPPCCTISADHQDEATLAAPPALVTSIVAVVVDVALVHEIATPRFTPAVHSGPPLHLVNSVFLI